MSVNYNETVHDIKIRSFMIEDDDDDIVQRSSLISMQDMTSYNKDNQTNYKSKYHSPLHFIYAYLMINLFRRKKQTPYL